MNPAPTGEPPLLQQAMANDAYLAAMSAVPSPPIANATPSYGSAPVHPPYAEMIVGAIAALKEAEGSSKMAIARYIEGAYPYLPPAHPALLTHHLKRLKNSGQLVMMKKSYMLPGSRSDLITPPPLLTPSSSVKRRPGRPPKLKTPSSDPPTTEISDPSPASSGLGTKRRGRPPKPKPALSSASAPDSSSALGAVVSPPGFEHHQPVYAAEPLAFNNTAALVNGNSSTPKRRGRPPKYSPSPAPVTTWTEHGGSALIERRPRGRPRKNEGSLASPPLPLPRAATAPAPRGRPKKRPFLPVDAAAPNVAAGIRRRGRPKGVTTGSRKLIIMRTGRPRGRPRKNASTVSTHASGQSEVAASVELTRKLEYMQLKVKNAVGLLKPHLINVNIIDILTAIQDLEEVATMEIVPPTIRETVTAPMEDEPIAPRMDEETAPATDDVAAPVVDLSAQAYPDPDPGMVTFS